MNAKEHYMDDKKNKQIINDGDTKVVAEKIKKQVNKNFGDVIYGDIIGLDEQAVSTILENRDAASRKEQIENARKNLDEAVHADNISSINVLAAVREVKKLLPEDFMANFYEVACGRTTKQLNKFLSNIDIEKNGKYVPEIADFLLKGMEYSSVLPLKTLVDIALRGSEKTDYLKKIEQEAKNLKDGVYSIQVPRDVFVAYSSKDYKVANEIVEYLEDNKISCFVALRNLRHGKGAVENYADALKESMHNCKCVVFLSSNNSRSLECDALKQEIPYIRDHEPQMGRIEYLLEDYNEGTSAAAKRICESFFKNLEYCRYNKDDKSDLLNRVLKYITGFDDKRTESVTLENPQGKLKYCLACGAENPERSKFCIECGAKVFAADYQGYLNAKNEKYLSDLRADLEAEYAQKYKKQQEELQKELGNRQKELEDLKKQNAEELEKQRNDLKKQNEELGKQREELKKQSEQLKSKSLQAPSYPTLENYDTNEFEIKEGALKKYKGNKTKVLIPFGITSIGDYAFWNCKSLTEITIPEGVTSIGERAFWNCESLTEITIPDSVISIDVGAFSGCRSLGSITVDKGNKVYRNEGNCIIETETQTLIVGCKTSKIPEGITSIGKYAFDGCESLREITIPDSVTSIGMCAFEDCKSLTEITIPQGVISIGVSAFLNCESLTEITIPDSVISIDVGAFSGCESLTEITIPDSVISIDVGAFLGCRSLESITVDKDNKVYRSEGNCLIEIDTKTVILGCKTSKIPDGVTSIGMSAFSRCTSLTEITIPDGVTSIGVSAFSWCTSLENITIPDSVSFIGDSAFSNTAYYNDADNWKNNVLYIGNYLIEAKETLSGSYQIPSGTKLIADYAFRNCTSLTEITIPDGVTSIGRSAFWNCTSLKEIIIPDGVTSIGSNAFSDCKNLTIYCEAEEKPKTWEDNWNANCSVVWGYGRGNRRTNK